MKKEQFFSGVKVGSKHTWMETHRYTWMQDPSFTKTTTKNQNRPRQQSHHGGVPRKKLRKCIQNIKPRLILHRGKENIVTVLRERTPGSPIKIAITPMTPAIQIDPVPLGHSNPLNKNNSSSSTSKAPSNGHKNSGNWVQHNDKRGRHTPKG